MSVKYIDIKCQYGPTCALGDRCLRVLMPPKPSQLYFAINPKKMMAKPNKKCSMFVDESVLQRRRS